MVVGTLYCNQDSFRAFKILIAAQYSGKDVDLSADFELGRTNLLPDFVGKFPLGKVPSLEVSLSKNGSVGLSESHAIAYFVSNQDFKGGEDELQQAQVLQWMCMADNEILPAVFNTVFPRLGLLPPQDTQGKLEKLMAILNDHLRPRTFIVGEKLSLADICVACNLLLLSDNDRRPFGHLCRWFDTVVNQKKVKQVIGNFDPLAFNASSKPKGLFSHSTKSFFLHHPLVWFGLINFRPNDIRLICAFHHFFR